MRGTSDHRPDVMPIALDNNQGGSHQHRAVVRDAAHLGAESDNHIWQQGARDKNTVDGALRSQVGATPAGVLLLAANMSHKVSRYVVIIAGVRHARSACTCQSISSRLQ